MTTRRSKKRRIDEKESINRLNVVLAVIFLLVASVLFKLYKLQVLNFDKYSSMASGQHDVFNKLKPERGRIFIHGGAHGEDKLYPVATNKEFALVFRLRTKYIRAFSSSSWHIANNACHSSSVLILKLSCASSLRVLLS